MIESSIQLTIGDMIYVINVGFGNKTLCQIFGIPIETVAKLFHTDMDHNLELSVWKITERSHWYSCTCRYLCDILFNPWFVV